MFFNDKELERIRRISEHDAYQRHGIEYIAAQIENLGQNYVNEAISQADQLRQRAEEFGGNKILRYGNYIRNLSEDCLSMAFYYRYTQKDEILNPLKQLIMLVCGVSDWCFQGKLNDWNSDLWTGDIGARIGIAYDSIRDILNTEERLLIEQSLWEKSFLPIYDEWVNPETHRHALDSMGHNWWNVCVSGAGTALLVLDKTKIKDYDTYVNNVIQSIHQWFQYPGNTLQNKKGNFGVNGDFIEHTGYMVYAFSNYCVFEHLLEKNAGINELYPEELFTKIPDYFLSMLHIYEENVKICDFGDISSNMHNAQFLFYLSGRQNRGDLLSCTQKLIKEITSPFELFFHPDYEAIGGTDIQAPCKAIYNHSGYAMLRTGYTPQDTSFIIKTGESWNHNHLDVGTFELFSDNIKLITDSGTCTYSKDLYNSYYTTPKAHNIILFNGKGQHEEMRLEGTKYPGNFPSYLDAGDYTYLLADCTGPYMNLYRRFYRHIIMTAEALIIVDDLQSYDEGEFSHLLHFNGDLKVSEDKMTILNGDKSMDVYVHAPGNLATSIYDDYRHEVKLRIDEDGMSPRGKCVCTKANSINKRQKFITVFALCKDPDNMMAVKVVDNEECTELTINSPSGQSILLINHMADGRIMHKNSTLTYREITTDGFLTYISRSPLGTIDSIAAHNTSLLKINNSTYISSLIKCDTAVNYLENKVYAAANADTEISVLNGEAVCRFDVVSGKTEEWGLPNTEA